MVDLTTLEGADTPGRVTSLCTKAMRPDPRDLTVPVGRRRVRLPRSRRARSIGPGILAGRGRVGRHVVPLGTGSLDVKLMDVREAVAAGADEIDMVIDRGAFLSGGSARCSMKSWR